MILLRVLQLLRPENWTLFYFTANFFLGYQRTVLVHVIGKVQKQALQFDNISFVENILNYSLELRCLTCLILLKVLTGESRKPIRVCVYPF